LIGAPPGYVGYDEAGGLTETVRHRPYSVILFDEIEKAHPEVFNVLLQVLDNGRLTDSKGRVVNFRNTVIIMTSNIGAQHIERMEKLGFAKNSENRDKENYAEAKNRINGALKDYFRPEFLNRVDDIIIFDILSPEAIKDIVGIQVAEIVRRLKGKGIELVLNSFVYDYLSKEGYNPQYGARPLKRLIQNMILTPVANLLIAQKVGKGGTINVDVPAAIAKLETGEAVALKFTFDVKNINKRKNESPIIVRDLVQNGSKVESK
jgi:ATP-dependent Clp protease ATP-binding subunit ClpC